MFFGCSKALKIVFYDVEKSWKGERSGQGKGSKV